jgi:CheY-like chemotaxis protein
MSTEAVVPAPEGAAPGPEAFTVVCHACRQSYDAVVAAFCACLATERTLECPHCRSCSCAAPVDYRRRFWTGAPPSLWRRKLAEHVRLPEEAANPAPDEVVRPLVLLVDDEPDIRRMAALEIQALGYGLVVARNGEEGLDLARRFKPDLVLSDALMPRMDGREMCRLIKEDPELAEIKVVVMTSLYKGVKYENQAYKSYRVDGYLEKPVQFAKLKEALRKHLPSPQEGR